MEKGLKHDGSRDSMPITHKRASQRYQDGNFVPNSDLILNENTEEQMIGKYKDVAMSPGIISRNQPIISRPSNKTSQTRRKTPLWNSTKYGTPAQFYDKQLSPKSPISRLSQKKDTDLIGIVSKDPSSQVATPSMVFKPGAAIFTNNQLKINQRFMMQKDKVLGQIVQPLVPIAPIQNVTYFNDVIEQKKKKQVPITCDTSLKTAVGGSRNQNNRNMGNFGRNYQTINTYNRRDISKQVEKPIQERKQSIRSKNSKVPKFKSIIENPIQLKHKAEVDKLARELDMFTEELNSPHVTEDFNQKFKQRINRNITVMNKERMKTTLGLKSRAMLKTSGQNTERSPAPQTSSIVSPDETLDQTQQQYQIRKMTGSNVGSTWSDSNNQRQKINYTELLELQSKNTNMVDNVYVVNDSQSGASSIVQDRVKVQMNQQISIESHPQTIMGNQTLYNKLYPNKNSKRPDDILSTSLEFSRSLNNPFSPKAKKRVQTNQVSPQSTKAKKPHKIELDYDKVKEIKCKFVELPNVLKPVPRTSKNKDLKEDYRLPSNFKFTSDQKYTNVDDLRDQLRKNRIDHMNFEPFIGSNEGKKYYGEKVYKLNQTTFQEMSPKDIARKNKLMRYTKSINARDPNEIDLLRDAEEMEKKLKKEKRRQRKLDKENGLIDDDSQVRHYSSSSEKSSQPSSDGPTDQDMENDLYKILLKDGPPKLDLFQHALVRGTTKPIVVEKQLSFEQIEMQKMFQRELQRMMVRHLYREFLTHLDKTETGELKINMGRSAQIELMTKQMPSLKKFVPAKYDGSLRMYIQEIREKMEAGFVLDKELINGILNQSLDDMIREQKRQKARAEKRKKKKEAEKKKRKRPYKRVESGQLDSENSFVQALNLEKSQIEKDHARDINKAAQRQEKVRLQFLEMKKLKREGATFNMDEKELSKLAEKGDVDKALQMIKEAAEAQEKLQKEEDAKSKKGILPTFSGFRQKMMQIKVDKYNARQKKLQEENIIPKGVKAAPQVKKKQSNSLKDSKFQGRQGSNRRLGISLQIERSSTNVGNNKNAVGTGGARAVLTPNTGNKKLNKAPLKQISSVIESDDLPSEFKVPKLKLDDMKITELEPQTYRETKASSLRKADIKKKTDADSKMYEKKKKEQLKYQRMQVNLQAKQDQNEHLTARQNLLTNSINFGVSNVPTKKDNVVVKKVMALSQIKAQNRSDMSEAMSDRIQDINELIQDALTPKVQEQITIGHKLKKKYHKAQQKAEISVDITRNRKINEIKNQAAATDEDTYLRYDDSLSEEPDSPVLKRKRRKPRQRAMTMQAGAAMALVPEEFSSYGSLLSSYGSSYSELEGSESEEDITICDASSPSPVQSQGSAKPRDDERPATTNSEQQYRDMLRKGHQRKKRKGGFDYTKALVALRRKLSRGNTSRLDEERMLTFGKGFSSLSRENRETQHFTSEQLREMRERLENVTPLLDTNLAEIERNREEQQEVKQAEVKRRRKAGQRSHVNRQNLTVLMRSLERQFQARGWLKETSLQREEQLRNIEAGEGRLKSGIENYLYLIQKVPQAANLTKADLEEVMPQIKDILKQNEERDKYDYDNFLAPDVMAKYKKLSEDNARKAFAIGSTGQKGHIWKPTKLKLNLKLFNTETKV